MSDPVAQSLNNWAAEIHRDNAKWWSNPSTGERIERNDGELLMLMVSEISEGMEGLRKGLMDDKLPHRKMIEVEMADLFIRLMDFAGCARIRSGRSRCREARFQQCSRGPYV